jgi:hypothetical protein
MNSMVYFLTYSCNLWSRVQVISIASSVFSVAVSSGYKQHDYFEVFSRN